MNRVLFCCFQKNYSRRLRTFLQPMIQFGCVLILLATHISFLREIISKKSFLRGYIHHNRNIHSKLYISRFSSFGSALISQSFCFSFIHIIIRVFCPRAGPSLQTQEPKPEFCSKAGLPPQTRNPGCNFTRDG